VLEPIRIFSGSFCGSTLYANPEYVSPNQIRTRENEERSHKYVSHIEQMKKAAKRKAKRVVKSNPADTVFADDDEFVTDDDE